MKEIWKDIPEFKGYYQASNLGNIKSMPRKTKQNKNMQGKILTPGIKSNGYMHIKLKIDNVLYTRYVHRLVAAAFLGDIKGMDVNHKDCIKSNNKIHNLEWSTRKDNVRHAYLNNIGSRARLLAQDVRKIKNFYIQGMPIKIISNFMGVSKSSISKILTSQTWSYV